MVGSIPPGSTMNNSNFWNCFEIDCISRDFSYASYLELHKRTKQTYTAVSVITYGLLWRAFNEEVTENEPLILENPFE